MNKRKFASWCNALSDARLAEVSELCFEAVVTFENISLNDLRDGVRRALEDCWLAKPRKSLDHALELMKGEMSALYRQEPAS